MHGNSFFMAAVNAWSGFLTIIFSLLEHLSHWYSSPLRNGFQCTLANCNIKTKTQYNVFLHKPASYIIVEGNVILFLEIKIKRKHVNSGVITWPGLYENLWECISEVDFTSALTNHVWLTHRNRSKPVLSIHPDPCIASLDACQNTRGKLQTMVKRNLEISIYRL